MGWNCVEKLDEALAQVQKGLGKVEGCLNACFEN